MTREEMIAILVKSSGGERTKEDITALLAEAPDPEEEKFCICGELLDDGGNHYDHMSNGY